MYFWVKSLKSDRIGMHWWLMCGKSLIRAPPDHTKHHHKTRHENFHGKFSLCAEYLIRLIGQKLTCIR